MNWTSQSDGLLIQRWDENVLSEDIAKELEVPEKVVKNRVLTLRRHGVALKKKRSNLVGTVRKIHDEEIKLEVLHKIKLGITRSKIARSLSLTIGQVVGIAYRDKEEKETYEAPTVKGENGLNIFFQGQYRLTEDEMLQYPDLDPRDTTGRFFNDPLPGRSALDQRKRECHI